ncbi:hypothetical protein ONZ43_g7085 [Nemania bipapillata]|uniref:Uncharacterized protein n=1 Tax=Nemania bipapillata TaxID=110536 RepID=A0ACC2HTU8_9PEZI|nr:hypothetical protein ONZ43_g7085 [Nemania bipapillata]
MAASNTQATSRKSGEKKATEKRVRKTPNPNQKRGQPTAAARLISSPYIKFGWHKPLSGEVKESVQRVSSMADSMYMLQIERERPIESLSLRNGIFWEQRQLANDSMISTPAVDHIDLFPEDEAVFHETLLKIGKQPLEGTGEEGFLLHYMFSKMRSREFLLLPIELDGNWVTVIARMRGKREINPSLDIGLFVDREVSDLVIVDPVPEGRESRHALVNRRLAAILAEGCIELSTGATERYIVLEDIECGEVNRWKTGLVAYAISREFLRRLKALQWRRDHCLNDNEEFLWAPFEEHYNLDAYRQSLMSACAHQTIEMSAYQVRMALEVPSDDSNYNPKSLSQIDSSLFFERDEKWEVFQSTHTFALITPEKPYMPGSPSWSPVSPRNAPPSPAFSTLSQEEEDEEMEEAEDSFLPQLVSSVGETEEPSTQSAPVAPMGEHELIPGLSLVNSPESFAACPLPPRQPPALLLREDLPSPTADADVCVKREDQATYKRPYCEDSDNEGPPEKRLKTEDLSCA